MANSSRKKKNLPIRWVRSDPVACGGFAFYVYLVRLVFHVDWDHGVGWPVGAENEGRLPRLTCKWMILVVKAIFSDPRGPVAIRWGGFGAVFYFYLLRLAFYVDDVHGGGRRLGAKKERRRPRLPRK